MTTRNPTQNNIEISNVIMYIYPPNCDFLEFTLSCSLLFIQYKELDAETDTDGDYIMIRVRDKDGVMYYDIMNYYGCIDEIELNVHFKDGKRLKGNIIVHFPNMMYDKGLTTFIGQVNLCKEIVDRMSHTKHKLNIMMGM